MDPAEVPLFDDLPLIEKLGLRHAWGVWGSEDELGSINFITAQAVVGACRLVTTGRTIRLDLPVTEPDPPMYGREPLKHTIFAADRNNWDDKLDGFYPQGSTQWDALRHVRCREFGFYGGLTEDPHQHGRLGIENWARHGIVGRGVLLDVAAYCAAQGEPLDPTQEQPISDVLIDEVVRHQGVSLQPGDILCIRTGWMSAYQCSQGTERQQLLADYSFPGLAADEAMARYLWNNRIAAIVADNPAIEVSPGNPTVGSLHRRLIPMLGYALGELFDLDELADACHQDGRWNFLFSAAPLYLVGGVGSPGNALALR